MKRSREWVDSRYCVAWQWYVGRCSVAHFFVVVAVSCLNLTEPNFKCIACVSFGICLRGI